MMFLDLYVPLSCRHHGTPANIIARRLIHYKRETFLLPLIAAAANQVTFFVVLD